MAMDLSDDLKAGATTEVTLTFADGDKVSFPAEVRAPGEAD
jgi:copper(I)-binding protein